MIAELQHGLLHGLQVLLEFTYYYPLFMAYLWMVGAAWFYLRYEFGQSAMPRLASYPRVTVVVPCFNEQANLHEVITHLMDLDYPDYEVIAVNDGSRDRSGPMLDDLARRHGRLRVIHHLHNQGKSIALHSAARAASSEVIIGIDGDALLDRHAIAWFVWHFQQSSRVGAVTGNPRIRTRSTLLGRIQVGEFSSLVGLIKRAQRVFYRQIFTASGVITAFRRSALEDVGYWSADMLTEDMDITWKLQLRKWDVRFEPRALAWILMPETFAGLWKQRLRWAMGGMQIIGKYKGMFLNWRTFAVWPLFFEHLLSVLWAFSVAAVALVYVIDGLTLLFGSNDTLGTASTVDAMTSLLPQFSGVIIGTTCLLQMLVSMAMDRRYDRRLLFYYAWAIWYPFGFWLINMLTIIVALPAIALRKRGQRARWVSPDRGNPPPQAALRANDQPARPLVLDLFSQQVWYKRGGWTLLTLAGWGLWIALWIPLLDALLLLLGDYTGSANVAAVHALRALALTLLSHAHALAVMVACFMGWALLQSLAKQSSMKSPPR